MKQLPIPLLHVFFRGRDRTLCFAPCIPLPENQNGTGQWCCNPALFVRLTTIWSWCPVYRQSRFFLMSRWFGNTHRSESWTWPVDQLPDFCLWQSKPDKALCNLNPPICGSPVGQNHRSIHCHSMRLSYNRLFIWHCTFWSFHSTI